MAADSFGMDLDAVGVPVTGRAAFAPVASTNVIPKAQMGVRPLVFPDAAKDLGLYKVDGGPTPARESEDALEFFQDGYALAGLGTRTVVINLAQKHEAVLQLTEGREPDANGVIEVDAELPSNQFILYVLTRYRGGMETLQQGVASVTAVEYDQQERGAVEGIAVTFTWRSNDLFNGRTYWQWGPAIPAGSGGGGGEIVPTGVTAGEPGAFLPSNATVPATLSDLQALGALGQTTAWDEGEYIVLGNSSQAHWDGDSWETGAAE